MKPTLQPGLEASISVVVDERLTVPAVSSAFPGFDEMPPVFATAFMVGFAEAAAMAVIADHLDDGESTVGIEVAFDHTAATPVGMTVTADATLTSVDGRILLYDITLRDEVDRIGTGTHKRAVINRERFMERVAAKAGR